MSSKLLNTNELIGNRYGMLVIKSLESIKVKRRGNRKLRSYYFNCICDCGNEKVALLNSLKGGGTTSCGCKKSKYLENSKKDMFEKNLYGSNLKQSKK